MDTVDRQAIGKRLWNEKRKEVSWFQESLTVSLDLIHATGVQPGAAIIDIGGGARDWSTPADEGLGPSPFRPFRQGSGGHAGPPRRASLDSTMGGR